jgi:Tfp pilus assembly protein PilW
MRANVLQLLTLPRAGTSLQHATSVHAAPRAQRGFALVEAIISAGLIGFLAVTATWFWVDSFTLVRTVNADSAAIADARTALERVAREIREVKFAGGVYCMNDLPTSQPVSQFVFKKACQAGVVGCTVAASVCGINDFDVTVQSTNDRKLTLSYAGTLASPAVANAVTADNVTAFGIRFLDANDKAASGPGSNPGVRFVELSLTVQPTGVQATQATTVVALRNY